MKCDTHKEIVSTLIVYLYGHGSVEIPSSPIETIFIHLLVKQWNGSHHFSCAMHPPKSGEENGAHHAFFWLYICINHALAIKGLIHTLSQADVRLSWFSTQKSSLYDIVYLRLWNNAVKCFACIHWNLWFWKQHGCICTQLANATTLNTAVKRTLNSNSHLCTYIKTIIIDMIMLPMSLQIFWPNILAWGLCSRITVTRRRTYIKQTTGTHWPSEPTHMKVNSLKQCSSYIKPYGHNQRADKHNETSIRLLPYKRTI